MADPRVARQSNDIILKRVAQALRGDLFQRFNLPLAAITVLPAAQRGETVGAMIGLAYTYLEDDVAVALLEALKMTNVLQEWLAQGIEQGIEQGKVEGQRTALRLVVAQRFGAVPANLDERITAADGPTLDELIRRAIDVPAVDQL